MKTAEQAAAAKGWTLVEQTRLPSAVITLCKVGGYHPFVAHLFNERDGGFYYGDYCVDLPDGAAAYQEKVARYTRLTA